MISDINASMANKNNTLLLLVLLFFYLYYVSVSLADVKLYSNSSNFSAGCIGIERQALLKFKGGLEDPSGRLSSWVGEDCCAWKGVGCSTQTGNVIWLDLRNSYFIKSLSELEAYKWSCLGGKINPSLLDLKYLQYLDLSRNNFRGTQIPSFIGSLKNLEYLNLSYASFTGIIPSHLGNLSNLLYLDVYGSPYLDPKNILVSDINWLPGISSLRYLNLGYVNLSLASTSWLQSVNMLPSLSTLYLPSCDLRNLPQSLPTVNFTSLLFLNLQENHFSSSIPSWLFNISTLRILDLASSKIKGLVPNNSWRNFCYLQGLYLSSNEVSVEVKELLGGLSRCSNTSLQMLDLSGNNFSGEIPQSLGHFINLRFVYFGGNSLSGSIPESIGRLSFLEQLDLSNNKLSGTIPESIGQLNALTYLRLKWNSWEGNITESHFLTLKNLKNFSLSSASNSLAFHVRHDWVPPFSLEIISIGGCQMGPAFPAWLETQKELVAVSLVDCIISDTIPGWFWKLSRQISLLDLSNNQIGGTLPKSLTFSPLAYIDLSSNLLQGPLPVLSNVSFLYLNNNSFSGPVPSSLSKLKHLQVLILSNNQLNGRIHRHWKGLDVLSVIDLSKNNLYGGIPSSMFSLPALQWLKLNSNNLSGNLFQSLKNCTHLLSLDLSDNKFSGNLSNWMNEGLLSLRSLNLQANMFHGSIPEHLCHLPALHILVLSHNNLSGMIPSCLSKLSGLRSLKTYYPLSPHFHPYYTQEMELNVKGRELQYTRTLDIVNTIDLSGNNLQGEIPEDLTKLSYLGTLNLSCNQLVGKIPEKIGNLKLLETLDLSFNHLSGPIPPGMSSMTFLTHLNLSYNNLSGPIPSANQFRTFIDPSIYEGNPELCGPPLPTNCTMPNNKNEENDDKHEDKDGIEMIWLYSGMALGFVFGFWVVCGTLIVKNSWRHAYFRFVDEMKDRIYVTLAVKIACLQRKLDRNN